MAREESAGSDRLRSIDLLRGIAILWVIVYHLYLLMTANAGFVSSRETLYERFADRLGEGNPWHAFTALAESVFAMGIDGVTMFMLLSGMSLTIVTLRSGRELDIGRFYWQRVRRLLVPYWAGWALFVGTLALLALYRVQADGGSWRHNFQFIGTQGQISDQLAIDGLLLFPRGTSQIGLQALPPALWFVLPLLQYYLLFPVAYVLMLKLRPAAFALLTLAITMAATYWYLHYYDDLAHGYIAAAWWPFRCFEFGLGMAMGYWLVHRPGWLIWAAARAWVVIAVAAGAIAMHTASAYLGYNRGDWSVLNYPMIVAALGIVMLLVVAVQPGRVLASLPARGLAWAGVISYTLLIANESMRILNTYFVAQGWEYTPAWWAFIVLVYVPGSLALAYPLAAVLGLLPRARAHTVPVASPQADLART